MFSSNIFFLPTENVPGLYKEIFKTIISSPVHARKEVLTNVLLRSKLSNEVLSQVIIFYTIK